MRRPAAVLIALALLSGHAGAQEIRGAGRPGSDPPLRDATHYNLNARGLALAGYDPVSYHAGPEPVRGSSDLAATHAGVTYWFAVAENRERFLAEPWRYEPAYGGWCAYTYADGFAAEGSPTNYVIHAGRLFLFRPAGSANVKADWQRDREATIARADGVWFDAMAELPPDLSRSPTLAARLDERRAAFNEAAPAELAELYERGKRDVRDSGVMESALRAGDRAPDFTLRDDSGGTVRLSDKLLRGPVVLIWYRGGWCPYCNINLAAFHDALPRLDAYNATVLAISPETVDRAESTREGGGLGFAVLSDQGNAVARAYGLVYTLPAEIVDAFKGKFDLASFNGDSSNTLPLAATYVIAPDGTIAFSYLDHDYTRRAEPRDVIDALQALRLEAIRPEE